MEKTLIGLLVSVVSVLFLFILFLHERKRKMRYGESLRSRIDVFLLQIETVAVSLLEKVGLTTVRQIVHYVIHTILRSTSRLLKQLDVRLQKVIRTNKKLAQTSEKDNLEKSKLEELALHKATYALTDEEKRVERERSLNAG